MNTEDRKAVVTELRARFDEILDDQLFFKIWNQPGSKSLRVIAKTIPKRLDNLKTELKILEEELLQIAAGQKSSIHYLSQKSSEQSKLIAKKRREIYLTELHQKDIIRLIKIQKKANELDEELNELHLLSTVTGSTDRFNAIAKKTTQDLNLLETMFKLRDLDVV